MSRAANSRTDFTPDKTAYSSCVEMSMTICMALGMKILVIKVRSMVSL